MAETIGEALRLLQKLGCDIMSMSLDNNNPTEHFVNHKFKERMILPFVAITSNVNFVMSKGDHYITTADKIRCKVVNWNEKHICELEEEIQKLYGIDAWSFVKRWYKSAPQMDSMHFLVLDLKKGE